MDEKKPREKEQPRPKEKEAAKKPSEAQSQAAGPAPAPKSNKLVFIGVIAGVIVLEVVLGIMFVKMTMPGPQDDLEAKMHADSLRKVTEEATSMGATTTEMPIEVVVNIAGTDGDRFLKAAVVLEYDEPELKEKKEGGHGGGHGGGEKAASPLAEAIAKRMPKYKSFLIENLSKMSLIEVTAPDAKEKIRKDFLRMVNGSLPPSIGEVKDIFFTQFIIQ